MGCAKTRTKSTISTHNSQAREHQCTNKDCVWLIFWNVTFFWSSFSNTSKPYYFLPKAIHLNKNDNVTIICNFVATVGASLLFTHVTANSNARFGLSWWWLWELPSFRLLKCDKWVSPTLMMEAAGFSQM